jgi:hypothetical protein
MKAECEPDVAFLDRILRIAQQMGQAHLANHPVPELPAVTIRSLRCLSIGCAAGTFGSYAQTCGRAPSNSVVTTDAARVSAITW